MVSLINNKKNSTYLKLLETVFLNIEANEECRNFLRICELLLVISFTNATLERMFSRILRMKTDWRNRLNRQRLDALLHSGEEGQSIGEFDPNDAINLWFIDNVRRLTASQPKSCSEKRQNVNDNDYVNIATLAMSDIEDDDIGFQGVDFL